MSLKPTADQLAALDLLIRHAAEERSSLLQVLARLQLATTAPLAGSPALPVGYGYAGSSASGGYTGINAHLLASR